MGHRLKNLILLSTALALATAGCSVAVPDVTSLLSNLDSFSLTANNIRISNLSSLTSINLAATCDSNNMSFEYELPDSAPGVWLPVPVTSSGIFTSVSNQCTTGSGLSVTLDLSTTSPFSTMALGSTYSINFRDINTMNLSTTEAFSVTYSNFTLSDSKFINGQGFNNTKTSGAHSLKGQISNVPQIPLTTSGSYSLQGKILFK